MLLLAFALRVGRLEYQSLWYDEGSSVFLARQDFGAITFGADHDIHPPLYYYVLRLGMLLGGDSEYAVRFLSVISGALIVALAYALGRRLLGRTAGLLAALAGAVSPLLVYYSQEARMYADVTLFGLLSTYLLVRATEAPKARGLWLAYGLASIACLYSQYIGALALVFQGLWVLARRPKALPPFIVSAGAAVLAFAPWLALAKDSLLGWPSTNAFHAGPQLFGDAAYRYVEGLSRTFDPVGIGLTAAVCAAAAAGLLRAFRGPRPDLWLPVLYVAVPLALMFLLGFRKPVYNPKFALLALPGFLLLIGAGVSSLGKPRALGLALVLASAGYALNNYYANPQYARDDYLAIARFVATSERLGDAIILDAPGQEQIFPYYYHGSLPVIGLPEDRPLDSRKTAAALERLTSQYKRLWLVLYGTNGSDPENYVESWLAGKAFETQNEWFGDARLTAFAMPSSQPAMSQPLDATIGGFAHLTGYAITPQRVASGEVLQLGLKWEAVGPAPGNVKVFTHVIDDAGNIWAQRDSDPAGGARPTAGWRPGDRIDDNYGLLILPGTPPGKYLPELGMYGASDGKRLPVSTGGDRLLLPEIEVAPPDRPPSVDELRIPHRLDRSFGALRLLGYGLTLVGQDAERTTFAAGDEAHLTLFWQADRLPGADARVEIGLGDQVLSSGALAPQYSTSRWKAGDRYRSQYRFALAPGNGELVARLDGQTVRLVRIRVG